MDRNESAAFLRSDEDDPDFLRDKPMGWCPWCGSRIWTTDSFSFDENARCKEWQEWQPELDNRARYQEERMAEARVNERVNREVARGKDAPY